MTLPIGKFLLFSSGGGLIPLQSNYQCSGETTDCILFAGTLTRISLGLIVTSAIIH